MQINRLIEIVYVLLRQKSVTARELSERFNVSQRTIYRDIDTLSLSGIPVYTEKGKGGGIGLLPSFILSKSLLNEQEQNEILSALHGLSSVGTAETDQVLNKLSAVFNKNAATWMEVDFSDWNYADCGYFNEFKTAVLDRRIAEFDYYSTYGEQTHRRIEPVQIWFKSKAWYIKGFCLTRQDIRLFKLTRIKNLTITNEHFSARDLLASQQSASPPEHQKPDISLKFKIEPEMAFRIYDDFDDYMVEKQPDGRYIVSVTWPDDNWLYGFVLSYGEYIEVLEPEYMREIIKNKALGIAKKHL